MSREEEFPFASGILHLNHAGVGPWPRRTMTAIREFTEENMTIGTLHYAGWEQNILRLRGSLRGLIGAASSDEIALTKNTSEGISIVAYGLDWRPGDNVVVGRWEFPSNRLAWESLARRFGVEVRLVEDENLAVEDENPERALLACMDDNTKLLAVSSIQYATGCRMDLARIGQACKRHGSLLCVDAIQSLGAAPFDAQAVGADFVCADGHKWLLSPEGTGIFYCRRECLETLKLNQFGWHMTDAPGDYESRGWCNAPDATRFECGSLNHLGFAALAASLELLHQTGFKTVFRAVEEKVSYLLDQVDKSRFEILTPQAPHRRGGILTVRCSDTDNKALFSHLSAHGVLCARRAGGIRLSPHFYTPQAVLDRALELLHQRI